MLMQSSRSKRPHSEVDDCDECIPISKRINRLNLEGQRKSLDDQAACAQQEMGGQGVSVDPHLSPLWPNEMGQHLGPGYANLSQPAAQYQHIPGPSTYQPTSPGLLPNPHHMPAMQPPPVVNGSAQHPAFPGQPFPQQLSAVSVGLGPFPPAQHSAFQQVDGSMAMDNGYAYDPELGEGDNPHYYHINQLLFSAHCQRMRREGFPLDSGSTSFS